MRKVANVFISAIAALHLYIAWFEMFAWETRGPKVFSAFPVELFAQTIAMAANQGLYNAFLAIGLLWSLVIKDPKWRVNVAVCFLLFVVLAGVFGAFTVSLRILYIQAVPAVIALAFLYAGREKAH
ncbi:MAG: DUF1304 domain-containing protein [Gammaproteobacteria bacterium]|nr:DUF1304 domain-containing protein [Gammaproteobacteria bacterium]